MTVEGVLLAGGASRRMGTDKASLVLGGIALGERIVGELSAVCAPVTVLGNRPIAGAEFLADARPDEGPLIALARFIPTRDSVFVTSCDLPWFDRSLVVACLGLLGEADAVVPILEERRQPLCALYRASAFALLPGLVAQGATRMRDWLEPLRVAEFGDPQFVVLAQGVNTPEEWDQALSGDPSSGLGGSSVDS